jgi:hypothetical protein
MARHNVLVQSLAGSHAEHESIGHQRRDRRRGLGDNRRVVAEGRAGDARSDPEPRRRGRDASEHAPDERALALRLDPWVEVVGDHCVFEADRFGALGKRNEVRCRMFFAR